MEPIPAHEIICNNSVVHKWRVAQLTGWESPRRWPKLWPLMSTGIRSPRWCTAAARPGLPCASSDDGDGGVVQWPYRLRATLDEGSRMACWERT